MKELNLDAFPKQSKDEWEIFAKKQLKGANPQEALKWENKASISLEGYYDETDLIGLAYLNEFFSSLPNHRWKLYETIEELDEKTANAKAISALMGGCDGIIFKVQKKSNLNDLLQDINREICDINFSSQDSVILPNKLQGFSIAQNGNCTITNETENPVTQILELLMGLDSMSYTHRTAFTDFFLEIATVRALRFLLSEIESSYTHIHTHIPLHNSPEHQWFLNTTAGLASILGGSNSIDFSTAQGHSRISRNVGNLIREESSITEYTDQCGGSYYIEVLTHHIIQKVKKAKNEQ